MKKVKWALIGCGNVVLKNKYSPFINRQNEIVSICTSKLEHSKSAIKMLKLKKCNGYDDIYKMLKNEMIDAVYICTPPKFHYEYLKILSKYNISVIYVEKPFTLNFKEANDVLNIYKQKQTKIFVAHYKRLTPQMQKLKKIINSKKYGKIIKIEGIFSRIYNKELLSKTWIYNKEISGGGRFFDISPHILDTLYYVFGKIKNISSNIQYNNKNHECETMVNTTFTINSIPCVLNFDLESNFDNDVLCIFFEKNMLITSINRNQKIYIYNEKNNLIKTIKFKKIKVWGKEAIKEIDNLINKKNKKISITTCYEASIIQKYIDKILKRD